MIKSEFQLFFAARYLPFKTELNGEKKFRWRATNYDNFISFPFFISQTLSLLGANFIVAVDDDDKSSRIHEKIN